MDVGVDLGVENVWNGLRSIGYDRTLVAEMIPPDPTLLERTIRAMDIIVEL